MADSFYTTRSHDQPKRRVVIPAFVISSKNGLWFYVEDMIRLIVGVLSNDCEGAWEIHIYVNKWQSFELASLDFDEQFTVVVADIKSNKFNFCMAWMRAAFSRQVVLISPTLRPFIGLNTYFIVHDFWPMQQPDRIKRLVSKTLFALGTLLSNRVFISKSHSGSNWADELILPNDPGFLNEPVVSPIICDVLLVGVETERKRFLLFQDWLDYAVALDFIDPAPKVVIVGSRSSQSSVLDNVACDVNYLGPDELLNIRPRTANSIYLSLSSEEGFNRGAKFAQAVGFNLHLSDIPVHREFFPDATFFSVDLGQIIDAETPPVDASRQWDSCEVSRRRVYVARKILGLLQVESRERLR